MDFDSYAQDYETALDRGVSVSGEDRSFFATERILALSRHLAELGFRPRSVLDYGCGTGTASPLFLDVLGAHTVVGLDVSAESLAIARQSRAELPIEYRLTSDYVPSESVDLVFCNGVFHHIVPEHQLDAARFIAQCLRPAGLLAFWENNPWNPGARYVMSRIPFDKDAIMLSARSAKALLESAGFEILRIDYYFIFPRLLKALRRVEPRLSRVPIGAQYEVLCRKRAAPSVERDLR